MAETKEEKRKRRNTKKTKKQKMAKFNKAIILNLVLVVSLILMISMAESFELGIGFATPNAKPECNTVYGAESGDTCVGVAEQFKLSLGAFTAINPSLNCTNIFIGEWLCVNGTA